jgi:hypothetical protein
MREFKIGQCVYYHPRNRVKAEGRYVVMRLLPQNGEVRYGIRSEDTPSPPVHSQCKRTAQSPWPAMSLDGRGLIRGEVHQQGYLRRCGPRCGDSRHKLGAVRSAAPQVVRPNDGLEGVEDGRTPAW